MAEWHHIVSTAACAFLALLVISLATFDQRRAQLATRRLGAHRIHRLALEQPQEAALVPDQPGSNISMLRSGAVSNSSGAAPCTPVGSSHSINATSKMLVLARFKEDVSWLDVYGNSTVPHVVYTMGDSAAAHAVLPNKGREAMAYVTAILDHYDSLPDVMAFMHGHRTSWHEHRSGDWISRHLQWPTQHSYVGLQCPSPRRPDIFPSHPQDAVNDGWDMQTQSHHFAMAWQEVFGRYLGPLPTEVTAPCCAEFLVTKAAVLALPKQFYFDCRDWLLRTPLPDEHSARVFEYMWHVMFTEGHQRVFNNVPNCWEYLYGSAGN